MPAMAAAFVGRPGETPSAGQETPAKPHRGTLGLVLELVFVVTAGAHVYAFLDSPGWRY